MNRWRSEDRRYDFKTLSSVTSKRKGRELQNIPISSADSSSLSGFGALADAFGQVGDRAAYEFQVALAVICQFGREFIGGGGGHLLQGFFGVFGDAVGLFAEARLGFFFVARGGGGNILRS